MKGAVYICVGLGIAVWVIIMGVYRGLVLSVLWGWFAVPTFGLPSISFVPAMGISLVVSFLTHQPQSNKNDESGKILALGALMPLLALGAGWIIHQWMPS